MSRPSGQCMLLACVVVLFLASVASAGVPDWTVWVSNSGSDTTGDGSQDKPFLTTDRAFLLRPDDVQIKLVSGVYNVTVPHSATNIWIVGQPSATLSWLRWTQQGETPLQFYASHLLISYTGSDSLPMLQLNGAMSNLTLADIAVVATTINSISPIVSLVTSPVPNSIFNFNDFSISNNGTGRPRVDIEGYGSVLASAFTLQGELGPISFNNFNKLFISSSQWLLGLGTQGMYFQSLKTVELNQIHSVNLHARLFNVHRSVVSKCTFSIGRLDFGAMQTEPCPTGIQFLEVDSSTFSNAQFSYTLAAQTGSCSSDTFIIDIHQNSFQGSFSVISPIPLDFSANYWGSSTGPRICTNPEGSGATLGFNIDYSYWCENVECTRISPYPLLLKELVVGPCKTPTPGSIAAFIVIFFVMVLAIVGMTTLYCLKCTPKRTDAESINYHYAHVTSVMAAISAIALIILAITGIIGSGACPTRTYATKCPFTLTDRAVAANGLLFGAFIGMVAAMTIFLLFLRFTEQRPILYTLIGFQGVSGILSLVVIIISMMNLSSALRGPYMHLLAVPATGYIIFVVFQLYHLEKLREFCRHTHIAMELSDYKTEKTSLLSAESPEAEAAPSTSVPVVDEYTIHTVPPLQVFYSDYQKITQRYLFVEASLYLTLFAFAIWYTVSSYRGAGGILLTVIIIDAIRLVVSMYISHHRGPVIGFKTVILLSAVSKVALLGVTTFLYVQVFTLTSHVSAYFTASLLGPVFFVSSVSTIRVWKMYEAIREKQTKLQL